MPVRVQLSPDGQSIAYGIGEVYVQAVGADVATRVSQDGRDPQWGEVVIPGDTFPVVYCGRQSTDGPWFRVPQLLGRWQDEELMLGAGMNTWSVAGPFWGAYRAAEETIYWSHAPATPLARDPAVNSRGRRAWCSADGLVLYIDGAAWPRGRGGPVSNPRWSDDGSWLVWEEDGRLYDQFSATPLNVNPDRREGDAVPLVTPSGHRWLLSTDDNRTILRPAGIIHGYLLADQGDQYWPHARVLGGDLNMRVAWSTRAGEPRIVDVDTRRPTMNLWRAADTPGPDPDPDMPTPGVSFVNFAANTTLLLRGGATSIGLFDRNAPQGTKVELLLDPTGRPLEYTFRVRMTNAEGDVDTSGPSRRIRVEG